ncbi:MAG: hypothetical protein PHW08_00600 [Kiritimatiellae bacterium]|nr:hypothetical protein [Kiritimatiellia bacterium]
MKTPTAPQPGYPVTANWGREVCDALRRMRLQAGPGIRLSQTPEGTTITAAPAKTTRQDVVSTDPACMARVVSGNALSGYKVDLYADGLEEDSTGTGTLFFPEVAAYASQDLPAGSVLLAHPALLKAVEGLSE